MLSKIKYDMGGSYYDELPNVLVLGGRGMLGIAIRKYLPEALYPTSFDLNLLDEVSLSEYVKKNDVKYVIFAAGKVKGLYGHLKDDTDMEDNYDMGYNVASVCVEFNIPLINISSSCIYSPRSPLPYKEEYLYDSEEVCKDNSLFASSKRQVIKIINYFRKTNGLKATTLVLPNMYGVRRLSDAKRIEDLHFAESFAYQISLTGEFVVKGSLDTRREIVSANSVARFIVNNYEKLPYIDDNVLNVGEGVSYSFKEIADEISRITGAKYTVDSSAYGSIPDKFMDISKFKKYGFKEIIDFKTDLREYLQKPFIL
jgi:nucleoside-diphosphate-sugar epimerase